MRRGLVLVAVLLALVGSGCRRGGSGNGDDVVTGRVTSISTERACVSPNRGATTRCLGFVDAPSIEVGQCVRTTAGATPEANRFEVVAESACAAGDLGGD